jgi:hypothetical protein
LQKLEPALNADRALIADSLTGEVEPVELEIPDVDCNQRAMKFIQVAGEQL